MPLANDSSIVRLKVARRIQSKKNTTGRLLVWLGLGAFAALTIVFTQFWRNTPPTGVNSSSNSARAQIPIPRTAASAARAQSPLDIAVNALSQDSDPDRREQLLARIAQTIPANDLPHALDRLSAVADANALELRLRLVHRWADLEPAQAAAWAAALPENSIRGDALVQVATVWANSDPEAAADWIQSLPEGEETTVTTVLAFTYEAARSNPLSALEAAVRLTPSPQRDAALSHCLSQWATSDPNQAYAWARNVPDAELREQLIAAVLTAAADQDGSIAAGLAASELNPGDERDRLVVAVVQRWAQRSPETAAAWVAQFPNGALRSAAVANLAAIWSATDPDGARAWIDRLAPGQLREEALRAAGLNESSTRSGP